MKKKYFEYFIFSFILLAGLTFRYLSNQQGLRYSLVPQNVPWNLQTGQKFEVSFTGDVPPKDLSLSKLKFTHEVELLVNQFEGNDEQLPVHLLWKVKSNQQVIGQGELNTLRMSGVSQVLHYEIARINCPYHEICSMELEVKAVEEWVTSLEPRLRIKVHPYLLKGIVVSQQIMMIPAKICDFIILIWVVVRTLIWVKNKASH
ncbi:MAG TPA: hypothetical protein VD999_01590 [Vitreimonas sp.]|nr:hypothetical protein [Vitreimonas sp.]